MTDYTVSRLGQINGSGDTDALFMKVFSGEILASYDGATYTNGRTLERTIANGKSASFPVLGRTTAHYHTPGTELTGGSIQHNEKVITINDLLLTDVFLANIDEAKNHFDVRAPYAKEMGSALARQKDRHVLQTGIQAALTTTASVASETDRVGSIVQNTDVSSSLSMATDADTLIAGLFAASEALDNKFVPEEGRVVFLKPKQYNLLANGSKVLNVDYGNAGNGSISGGKVMRVANMEIVKATSLPQAAVSANSVDAGTGNRQQVDATNVVALVMHPSAVGTLKLLDLATEMEYQISRQGTLFVAKYAMGHGVLRPEAAVLLRTAAPS